MTLALAIAVSVLLCLGAWLASRLPERHRRAKIRSHTVGLQQGWLTVNDIVNSEGPQKAARGNT